MVEGPIYHLALASDWDRDQTQAYSTSTLGRSLNDEGFIHCSFRDQVRQIADVVYRGRADVVLLEIDPARLVAAVRVESLDKGGEAFPHIYGPVNRDAVVRIASVGVLDDGRLDIAGAM